MYVAGQLLISLLWFPTIDIYTLHNDEHVTSAGFAKIKVACAYKDHIDYASPQRPWSLMKRGSFHLVQSKNWSEAGSDKVSIPSIPL